MTGATRAGAPFRASRKVQPVAIAVEEFDKTGVSAARVSDDESASPVRELGAKFGGGDGDAGTTAVHGAFLKAFLFSMAAFGLFHPMRIHNFGYRWWPIVMAYSLCCLGLLAADIVRLSATMFQAGDPTMQTNQAAVLVKLANYWWKVSVFISAIILFVKNCVREKGFACYYRRLNAIVGKLEAAGMRPDPRDGRQVAALCLAVGWALVVANAAYGVLYVFSALKGTDRWALRWRTDGGTTESEYEAVAYVNAVAVVYGSGAMTFPVVYVLVICMQMCSLWSCFNDGLDRATASHPAKVLSRIGDYRRLYGEVCEVVSSANDCIAHLIGVHMCFNFVQTIMQAYLVATNGANEEWENLRVGVAVWLVSGLAIMAVEFGVGCVVIEKARKCEEYLERIQYTRGSDIGCEHLVQLQLFLNQIGHDRGFSIFGIYPINMDSLLPMVGTWITYLLILVQSPTNMSASTSAPTANNSINASSAAAE